MREFYLTIDEALKNGLCPHRAAPFNSKFLLECLGWRVGSAGLEKYETKDDPIPSTVDTMPTWPFPQFITGERYNFLVVRDDVVNMEDIVYLVSDNHQTVTYIFSVDELTFGQGTLMEVADFGEYAFMTNGVIMIYWDTTLLDWHEIVASATIPMMRTICNFKGQAVGGNIVSAWYDCDETFYVWSKIGEMDFTPEDDNEAGYRRCPYGGEVYHTRVLGDSVIGYSSKGVTKLTPVSDPAVTMGFTELSDIGLINRGAIDGNDKVQVYVGEDKILRRISPSSGVGTAQTGGIEELGYESYMEQLTGDVIVQYDPKLKDFYIGDSEKTFLLTPYGMSEIPQHPSAVWRRNNETYMLPADVDDYKLEIEVWPFDFGYGGQKTIFEVETDAFLLDLPEASISYYLDFTTYNTLPYVPLNNQNIASIIAAGNIFSVHLRSEPTYDNSRIGYITVRYKMTDLRGLRGIYASSPRGQS